MPSCLRHQRVCDPANTEARALLHSVLGSVLGLLKCNAIFSLFLQVTKKGREALTRLREQRGTLQLDAKVSRAYTEHDTCWDWLPNRCKEAMCRAPSECDTDDPVSEPDSDGGDSDGGSSGGLPGMDFTHFDDFACVDSD